MLALIKSIIYIATFTGNPVQEPTNICAMDLTHLNHSTQIEISIGCSKVNGRRVYSNRILEDLYNE